MADNYRMQGLFQPIQPAVFEDENSPMRYREYVPSAALKPHIYCYWALWTELETTAPFTYRIVSDGCVDLFINCRHFEDLNIAGTASSASTVLLEGKVSYFGIRFLPGGFYHLFKLPMKEIANKMVSAQEVCGNRLTVFESRFYAAQGLREKIAVTEAFLLRQVSIAEKTPDPRLRHVLEKIYQKGGQYRIETDLAHGISARQLRRIFDRHIGLGPKAFARVVRFQSALRAMRNIPQDKWGELSLDFGYYDQSHFIHDFRIFSGSPPLTASFSPR